MVYSADNRSGRKNDSDPNNLTSIMDTASKSDSKLVNKIQDFKIGLCNVIREIRHAFFISLVTCQLSINF